MGHSQVRKREVRSAGEISSKQVAERFPAAYVRSRYEDSAAWFPIDPWHRITSTRIRQEIEYFYDSGNGDPQGLVINLGSGAIDYGLPNYRHVHLDLALSRLRRVKKSTLGTVESIPLRDRVADLILCTGQVLNYVDPEKAIGEIARIMKPSSFLILELEVSDSLEFILTDNHRIRSTSIRTSYNGRTEVINLFSIALIESLIRKFGLTVIRRKTFHILSALALRLGQDGVRASRFSPLDGIVQRVPFIKNLGANMLLTAKRGAVDLAAARTH